MFLKNSFSIFYALCISLTAMTIHGWKFSKPSTENTLYQMKKHGTKVITLVFDPAGRTGTHQRMIDGISEPTITYQLVLSLKKKLEENNPYLRIVILRDTKTDNQLEHISAANQTHANLYINFQAYQSKQKKNSLGIYHMLYRTTDTWPIERVTNFLPINLSHRISIKKTIFFEKTIMESLVEHKAISTAVSGMPLKSLLGLTIPALLLELGLAQSTSYELFIDPLVHAFSNIIVAINNGSIS